MDIEGRDVLILGGSGLVGTAVGRALMRDRPRSIVVCGLTRAEAEAAAAELRAEPGLDPGTTIGAEWGDVFLPEPLRERRRADVLGDAAARGLLVDDLYGDLTDEVVRRSALGALLERRRPHVIVDCVNTATAFAYLDVFDSAAQLRRRAAEGAADLEAVERHLATLYLPQLIRHVQIALEAMRRTGTRMYVKVGTAGTGGMGLNIPFTHSEERPSRVLLAKSGVAGAHTLLLYLMARTPGGPAVKEIKPTAAISWKRIGYGAVLRGGRPIPGYDATEPLALDAAFASGTSAWRPTGRPIEGVYLDAGENGLFSVGEFETLTALGLMEYITPEEIAQDVVREIRGEPTGHDVVAALDAATAGPTYRAGVMREVAIERMLALEEAHGVHAVAYEMLGPPRLAKLLFEGAILGRLYGGLEAVAALDAEATAVRAEALVREDADLRVRMLSVGVPILLADGQRMLRGPAVRVAPDATHPPGDARLVENGWVDLRPANWRRWSDRVGRMLAEPGGTHAADAGSRVDLEPARRAGVRPGPLAAWVFRHEDRGARIKR
jgi:NAD(P)-dependent dehydrogenase (short-subunit alcohol dehydrogenase family)